MFLLLALWPAAVGATTTTKKKNIVFLVVESTDGRTWSPGYSEDVIPLPNIRKLQNEGVSFERHYSNAPVCCPSRASFWSGRHAHRIPHESPLGGFAVEGAWNNYEGLPANFSDRIDQVLARDYGYATFLNGKTDWTAGSHSENVYLDAWTKYVDFPYDVPGAGGWYTELPEKMCASNGTVAPGNESLFEADWQATREAVAFAKEHLRTGSSSPYFLYTGHEIVHPPYRTSESWSNEIDRAKVTVPTWPALSELHPCDFQHSMRKGCTPADVNASWFFAADRVREIRAVYYAMIAEYDAMVGEYVESLYDPESTVFLVTSDHGDMQLEHQSVYKMSAYDASASVPMVIAPAAVPGSKVTVPTQLVDLFPTIIELAGGRLRGSSDGQSLLPFVVAQHSAFNRDFVVSQFHGDDVAMSWFAVVAVLANGDAYKLVKWGDGSLHEDQLFNLSQDPDELTNLVTTSRRRRVALVRRVLEAKLRSVVDYVAVAHDVADYNRRSLEAWIAAVGEDKWRQEIHKPGLRWDTPFDRDVNASLAALDAFRAAAGSGPGLRPCRGALVFSPSYGASNSVLVESPAKEETLRR
mmetsp:Transcript_11694/g.35063  ORF Transcript_11694/g.35063 Transcript_11694/m.35063 type:complete len:582 (+) Transcript_11694:20-1765(+)